MEATTAVSCCKSDEAVSAAGVTTMLGVVCARGAVCGANQPSCGDEFASIALAASPYDCQAKVAPIPTENMIRKRARPREALPPSDGPIVPTDEPAIGSRPGREAPRSVGNLGSAEVSVVSIGIPPLSSGWL